MALSLTISESTTASCNREFNEIKTYFERLGNVSCCERNEEFRGYARQNIVARVLLAQEAKRRLEPTPDAQIDAAVASMIQQYGGEVQFYAATGASPNHMHLVRHDVELDLRVKRMMDEMCSDIVVSEEELRQHYDKNIERLHDLGRSAGIAHPEIAQTRRRSRSSLCNAPPGAAGAFKGADFDAAAKKHSDKADEHIDLGFFKRGELT